MNVVGGTLSAADSLAVDRNSVRYALESGATPVRRCIGICSSGYLSSDERTAISASLSHGTFQGEWGSWDGTIAQFRTGSATGPVVNNTEGAINEALSLHANYLGWYVREQWVPIATCPSWAAADECGDNPSGRFVRVLVQPARGSDIAESLEAYAQRRLGYRLVLSALEHPGVVAPDSTFTMQHTWFQRAVGRVPWPLGLLVCFESNGPSHDRYCAPSDRSFDPSRWPVGAGGPYAYTSALHVPASTPPGSYAVLVGLVGAADDTPFVNLAIDGKVGADPLAPSLYRVSTVTVR